MANLPETLQEEVRIPAGNIVAENVSVEDYLEHYAANFCEWVEGYVIKMSPVHVKHYLVTRYMSDFFSIYLKLRPVARLREAPFMMSMKSGRKREPDLQIILKEHYDLLKDTMVEGGADICIEVLSPATDVTDRGEKFTEYEKAGVREYWMLDPIREESLFYRLNEAGVYKPHQPEADGIYHTPLLPGFALHVPTLWLDEDSLPDSVQILQMVQQMLNA